MPLRRQPGYSREHICWPLPVVCHFQHPPGHGTTVLAICHCRPHPILLAAVPLHLCCAVSLLSSHLNHCHQPCALFPSVYLTLTLTLTLTLRIFSLTPSLYPSLFLSLSPLYICIYMCFCLFLSLDGPRATANDHLDAVPQMIILTRFPK